MISNFSLAHKAGIEIQQLNRFSVPVSDIFQCLGKSPVIQQFIGLFVSHMAHKACSVSENHHGIFLGRVFFHPPLDKVSQGLGLCHVWFTDLFTAREKCLLSLIRFFDQPPAGLIVRHGKLGHQVEVMKDLKDGIKERGEITPEELAKLYVFESEKQFGAQAFTPTLAAVEMAKIGEVQNSVEALADSLLKVLERKPKLLNELRKEMKAAQHFVFPGAKPHDDFADLGDFAKRIAVNKKLAGESPVKKAAKNVVKAVKNAVTAEQHSVEGLLGDPLDGATGLSVYLPKDYGHDRPDLLSRLVSGKEEVNFSPTHGYEKTDFAKDCKWDELLKVVSKDKAFFRFLKARGISEKIIDKLNIINVRMSGRLLLFGLNAGDYGQLICTAVGSLSRPDLLLATSLLKGKKGINKIARSIKADYKTTRRIKLGVYGLTDTVSAAGGIIVSGAIFAGAGVLAVPAAAGVLALSATKAVVKFIGSNLKAQKAAKLTVSEKLKQMKKD